MKKIFSIICLAFICLGLASCSGNQDVKEISIDDVLEANEYKAVLGKHNSILSKTTVFADYEKSEIVEKKEDLVYVDENADLLVDSVYLDSEGKVTLSESYRNGLMYQSSLGDFAIQFVGFGDFDQYVVDNYLIEINQDAEFSEVVVEPLYAYFDVTYSYEVPVENPQEGEKTEDVYSLISTYFIDLNTYEFTNVEHVSKLNDELLEIRQTKYVYGVEKFYPELNAYNLHQNAEDAIELTIVVNHNTEEEEKMTYVVSNSSYVSTLDESYRLYKNYDYTKDVKDLNYIYEYGSIYYQPVQPEFSFEYRLTEDDYTEFKEIATALENAIINDEEREIVEDLMEQFNNKFEFIEAHYIIGQVNYYRNLKSNTNKKAFDAAVEMYYDMFEDYKAFCRAIYESESTYKEEFFEGWTEEDISILYVDPVASELSQRMTELEENANSLNYQAPVWAGLVCNLYKQYVDISKEYASYYGYENYYDYASENVYSRDYSREDLDAFHQYVKEYIVPLTKKYMRKASTDLSYLNGNQRYLVENILEQPFNKIGVNYVDLYIDSFTGKLNENFNHLFDKGAMFLESDSRAYEGAFVNYISYYEEPFAYFGPGYQSTYTIVHEMGHYASAYSYNFGGLNYDLAETHSQANEWLFSYFLKDVLEEEVHNVLVSQTLAEALQMVVIATAIDEFEQKIYNGNYLPSEYDAVMAEVHASYDMQSIYSLDNMQWYWKMVTLGSAVYYISYATSQIASINLYVVAENEGYEAAQEVYRKIQEEGTSEQGFVEVILNAGLPNPFVEETYKDMADVFGLYE